MGPASRKGVGGRAGSEHPLTVDTQLRMFKIIKVILAKLHGKEDIFAFGQDVVMAKWHKINILVSRSRQISLQKIPPQYCTYFDKIRKPSPGIRTSICINYVEKNEMLSCSSY